MMLSEKLRLLIDRQCHLKREELVLVGVSGGPDSLCLLDILHSLGYRLVVAHLDHCLRPESAHEAESIARLALDLGLAICLGKVDVAQYATLHHHSLEEAAREVRYAFLFEQARQHGCQAVAVGHTADDQVETVLMHLLRGAGLPGLGGMAYRSLPNAWSVEIPLVRPLLSTWRDEIMQHIDQAGLKPFHDATNLDARFYRNRLRHEALPFLEQLNPGLRQRLWQTASLLHSEDKLIESMTAEAWQECVLEETAEWVCFDQQYLRLKPLGVQRRLIRRAITSLRPALRNLDYATIERAIQFLEQPSIHARIDLLAGLCLWREGELIWVANWSADLPGWAGPQVTPGQTLPLELPGEQVLLNGWRIQVRLVDVTPELRQLVYSNPDPYQAWMDADQLSQQALLVRARRPGDHLQSLGMAGGSVKISDLMVNHKLPRRSRAGWPLMLVGETVVWVPGLRQSELYCLTESTARAVFVRIGQIGQ